MASRRKITEREHKDDGPAPTEERPEGARETPDCLHCIRSVVGALPKTVNRCDVVRSSFGLCYDRGIGQSFGAGSPEAR